MRVRLIRITLLGLLALVLSLGLPAVALAVEWSDLPTTTLDKYGLNKDDVAGISQGFEDGTWRPAELVTRAQFTKMAMEAFGIAKADPATASFSDVPATHQYYQWIEGAKAAGLVNGVTSTEFAPDATMTHEQCFAIVVRWVAEATKINMAQAFSVPATGAILAPFSDACGVSGSLRREVAMAVKYGVYRTGDWGNTLSPHGQVSRVQAAAALVRGAEVTGDRIAILGLRAGPQLFPGMSNTGFLLMVGDAAYMVDCGAGVPQNIVDMGMPYGPIKNVFFTHLHFDHTVGYADLLARGYAANPTPIKVLDVWGPPGTKSVNDGLMAGWNTGFIMHSWGNNIHTVPTAHDIDLPATGIAKVFEDDKVVVTATRVTHGPEVEHAYAYRFDIKATGKSVVFSGDTTRNQQLIELAKDCTVLVHEAQDNDSNYIIGQFIPDPVTREAILQHLVDSHTDVKDVPAIAKEANAGMVILHHYGAAPTVTAQLLYGKAVAAAQQVGYQGRIVAPLERDVVGF